jgi:hypothetical protein
LLITQQTVENCIKHAIITPTEVRLVLDDSRNYLAVLDFLRAKHWIVDGVKTTLNLNATDLGKAQKLFDKFKPRGSFYVTREGVARAAAYWITFSERLNNLPGSKSSIAFDVFIRNFCDHVTVHQKEWDIL